MLSALLLLGWFVLLAICELIGARKGVAPEPVGNSRLLTNFGLAALVLAAAAILPVSRIGSSAFAQKFGLGIGQHAHFPWLAMFCFAFIADSFAAYWLHRLMHAQPLLWRIHRVHHADTQVDVSTSLRNHPLELVVTAPVAAIVVLLIGAPPSAVIAAQSLSVAAALWQHADIHLPAGVESKLAWMIVTPRLHRLHHHPERQLHDSNFGELIVLWDRMFGTLNSSEGRRAVGLENQSSAADRLFEQIWSPLRT